jgi:hypothetical protein
LLVHARIERFGLDSAAGNEQTQAGKYAANDHTDFRVLFGNALYRNRNRHMSGKGENRTKAPRTALAALLPKSPPDELLHCRSDYRAGCNPYSVRQRSPF